MAEDLNKKFLEDMEINFPHHGIYRMADIKEEWKWTPVISILDKTKCETYNNDVNKFGIFFTPNGDFALSWFERKKDNAKTAYCFFYDIDEKKKTWEELEQEPSIVIETPRWYHVYRLLNEPLSDIRMRDDIEESIISLCSWDEWAKDIARIVRVPWYRHWKDNKWEFVIKVIHYKPENKYKVSDFLQYSSQLNNMRRTEESVRTEVGRDSASVVEDIDRWVDVIDVLYDLGGSKYTVMPNNAIKINWELTSWYKKHPSKNFLITFSPHDDRPTGWPFSVAKFFLVNHYDTFKYFREKYGIGKINDYSTTKNIANVTQEEKWKEYGIGIWGKYSIPIKKWEIVFDYEDNCIYRMVGNDKLDVLSWVLEPLGFYSTVDNRNVYITKYKSKLWESWILEFVELGRSGEMERKLSEVGITFFGTANDKKVIIDAIHTVRQKYQFYDKLGIYSKNCIINKCWRYIIAKWKEKIFVNISDISPADRNTNEVIKLWWDGTVESIQKTIDKLRDMYHTPISVTLFFAYALGFLWYYIRQNMWFLPIIILWGLTQAGKTALREALMDVFGIDKALEIQASTTEFILMKKSTHYIPLNIWEYRNSDTKFDWAAFIKNNYDWTKNERWRSNQSSELYEANAQLVIDGESQMMHNSIYSRTFTFFMNPKYKKRLMKFDNINKFFIDNFDKLEWLKEKYKEWRSWVSEEFVFVEKQDKDRIVDDYGLILAFADIFGLLTDEIKDEIMEQANTQMEMIGEDNVDKLVKSVMSMAKDGKFVCEFDDDKLLLRIDVVIDEFKYQESRIADLRSQIQTVNHHFMWGSNSSKESLYIPLSYLKKTRTTHMLFNMILNHICKSADIWPLCSKEILDYATKNGYTRQFFYDITKQTATLAQSFEDISEKAKRAGERSMNTGV